MESSKYPDNTGPSPIQLPPIVEDIEAAGSSTGHLSPNSSKPLKMDPKPWSRYHAGCIKKDPNYMDWSSRQVRKNEKCKELQRVGPKELTLRRMDKADFKEFLENNRDMVEGYVLKRMSAKQLDKWLQKKLAESDVIDGSIGDPIRSKRNTSTNIMFSELMYIFDKVDNEDSLVWNLTQYITKTIGVDAYRVYRILYDKQHSVKCLSRQSDNEDTSKSWNLIWRTIQIDEKKLLFILDIAKKGTIRKLSDDNATSPFPTTSDFLINPVNLKKREANYLMYLPISTNGKTMYVLELWKMKNDYTVADKETCSNFVVWSRLAMKYCDLYLDKKRERIMTNFLLDVVKEIFEEMVSLDHLIKRILEFAQRLVNADRASLFLVDYKHFELVSTVFDLKFEKGAGADVEKKEIRLPINRGIAGHVALSGETMNIQDAYSDLRFNRAIDEATGYKTNNILCMPIKVQGKVIGVVQMVNKRNSTNFDLNDEVAFETFSTFFGLALHHARLYDRIMRKEQKYRVALEVLSYHNTCRENEVQAIINDNRQININLNDFYLDPYKFNELEKCKTVISMFNDLFDLTGFNITTFTRFVLTVKKNYRTVPYHNFDHGWAVANSMYTMLKTDIKVHFNYKQRLSLFVACLCHDLDHRGYTNKYMSETASPLAAMYSTSTLEHHHFNITVTILQQDGHNIFSHMESKEYKEVLSTIKHCILATDLAAFFPNLAKLQKLHEQSDTENAFSWTYTRHRELAMSLSMTAADLCASAKPWDIQIKTVEVIIEEFYDQGDKEKLAGITPIPMMDRSKPEEQAASQVGFLTSICVPCYDMLNRILPNTEPMYMMVLQNLEKWRARADNFNETKSYTVQTPELDIKEENKEKSENNDTFLENKSVLNCGNQVWDTIEAELWDDDDEIDDENEKKILISEIINCFDEIDWTDDEGGVGEQKPSTSHAN